MDGKKRSILKWFVSDLSDNAAGTFQCGSRNGQHAIMAGAPFLEPERQGAPLAGRDSSPLRCVSVMAPALTTLHMALVWCMWFGIADAAANQANGYIRSSADETASSSETDVDGDSPSSGRLGIGLAFLVFISLLVLGILYSVYVICVRSALQSEDEAGLSFDLERSRSVFTSFREDLLNDDELLRLWICAHCDFANYEMKAQCALCNADKREKLGSRNSKVRPASVLSSASLPSTVLSSSLSPSFLGSSSAVVSPNDTMLSPRSSPLTSMTRYKRKEWRPALSDDNRVVWTHHADDLGHTSVVEDMVIATAFVSRNKLSSKYPHGKLRLKPAEGAQVYVAPSPINGAKDASALDPFALESIRALSFPEKHKWFMQETSAILHSRWDNPTAKNDLRLVTARDDLLHATMRGLIFVSGKQLKRPLRVRFLNEPGVDAGGIVREWFDLVMVEFLSDTNGLFQAVHTGAGDGLAYTINPNACIAVPDYLLYYRAFGRLLGKALLEGQLVPAALSDVLLKHIVGAPISFADLLTHDAMLAKSLQLVWETPLTDYEGEDEDPYALDFSVYSTVAGIVDLKPNGRNLVVTETNKHEYIALLVQWQLGRAMAEEMGAIVSGVYDVLPLHLLAPFDAQELRLMLSGSPVLDLHDWEQHTVVTGRKKHKTPKLTLWFWRILARLSPQEQGRILQFATGTARVPVQGFKALTTSDGRLCPFTINCVSKADCAFIRAYTCFNRLDLPMYKSEQELEQALRLLLQMEVTGFSIQ